jgi:hypothetical protein
MKTSPQTHTDLSQLAEKLSQHRVTMLTVAEGNRGLSSRPMKALGQKNVVLPGQGSAAA